MQPDEHKSEAREIIPKLGAAMARLGTGDLAQLRRMAVDGPGEGAFWRLQHTFGFGGTTLWMQQVRLMALLTPRGAPSLSKQLHVAKRHWGAALGETGYPERQVLRFLALRFADRPAALERMARWLAAKNDARGVNCLDLFTLHSWNDPRPCRWLAESYYPAQYKHDAQSASHKDDAQ